MTTKATALDRPRTMAAALVLGIVIALGSVSAAQAAGDCSSDSCDGGLWQAARGADNANSYWGMDAGHNCTNYVAWKLTVNGVVRPVTGPGNASTWADRAIADGYRVDSVPAVGAVAQWGSYEDGNGVDGHVAYVEKINTDGSLLISEDYWHGGNQLGPLTFRTVWAYSVPRFIHYGDRPEGLRTVSSAPGHWIERATGILTEPKLISAVNMGGASPEVVTVVDGAIYEARKVGSWQYIPTGIATTARALSAVNMGAASPQVVALEGSKLVVIAQDSSGWHKLDTGIDISGTVSAINAGGLMPTILAAQGGLLFRIWNNSTGWHAESTGIPAFGAISAVSTGGEDVEVFSITAGILQRSWSDSGTWYTVSTGVPISGSVAAVTIDGTAQLVAVDNEMIYSLFQDPLGWHKNPTGVPVAGVLSAADGGGLYPVIFQAG